MHELSPPYMPEYNGVLERYNRTLHNIVRLWLLNDIGQIR